MSKKLFCVLVLVLVCALLVECGKSERKQQKNKGARRGRLPKGMADVKRDIIAYIRQRFEQEKHKKNKTDSTLKVSQPNKSASQPAESLNMASLPYGNSSQSEIIESNCTNGSGLFWDCKEIRGIGCYCLVRSNLTWYQATAMCYGAGMKLVSIESYKEDIKLVALMKSLSSSKDQELWTSGAKDGEGNYYWSSTNQMMKYSNWDSGHPTIYNFDDYGVKLIISPKEDVWQSVPKSESMYFICEK